MSKLIKLFIIITFISIFVISGKTVLYAEDEHVQSGGVYKGEASWHYPTYTDVFLDGERVDSKDSTFVVGNHLLEVYYADGRHEAFRFTVSSLIDIVEKKTPLTHYYVYGVTKDIKVYLNDEEQVTNFDFDLSGDYEIKVLGVNNYVEKYKVTIDPEIYVSIDRLHTNSKNIILNNKVLESDDLINGKGYYLEEIGYHEIRITNSIGKTFTFKYKKDNCYIDNIYVSLDYPLNYLNLSRKFDYVYVVKKLPNQMFIDGKEIFEDTYLFYPGKYNIKVMPLNSDNPIEYDIVVKNNNYFIAGIVSVAIIGLGIAVIFVLAERKRVI